MMYIFITEFVKELHKFMVYTVILYDLAVFSKETDYEQLKSMYQVNEIMDIRYATEEYRKLRNAGY